MKELQTITLIVISVEQRMHTSHCTATDGHPWRLKQHPINLRDSHPRQLCYATDKQQGDNLSLATPRDSFYIFSVVSPELYLFLFFLDKYNIKPNCMLLLEKENNLFYSRLAL